MCCGVFVCLFFALFGCCYWREWGKEEEESGRVHKESTVLAGDNSSLLIKAMCGILSRWQKATIICFPLCLHYSSLENWSFLYRLDLSRTFFPVLFSPPLFSTHSTINSLLLVSCNKFLTNMNEITSWRKNIKEKSSYHREQKESERWENYTFWQKQIEFAYCFWATKWNRSTMSNLFCKSCCLPVCHPRVIHSHTGKCRYLV